MVGQAGYAYDGHGQRIWVAHNSGATKFQAYGQTGKPAAESGFAARHHPATYTWSALRLLLNPPGRS